MILELHTPVLVQYNNLLHDISVKLTKLSICYQPLKLGHLTNQDISLVRTPY